MLCRALRWLGHYYLHLRPRMNSGVLLLSDRHYFDDVAIDPRKYRYGGPHALVNRLRCRLPRPDLFIFLDAPPEVLFSRKQEIPLDEVVRLRAAYQTLLADQPNTRQIDASAPLPQVLAEVRAVIQPYLPSSQR
jgi:thymidylate kinase